MATHRADDVPLARDCVRVELGVRTGRGGVHIARGLERGPQFRVIHAVDDVRTDVVDGVVHAEFRVCLRPRVLRLASRVTETFEFDDSGRIRRIVARFSLPRRH
ncbi:hypothetical protein [Williamsia sterculiae]|uniref:hypothetical protein n=1 Tax=Williamsia sterculiae TaxID=1344003 RepID=UPI001F184BB9|nr:hypothetical protein [Williamsia sterculiae]